MATSQQPVARLGDTSDHGGYIISASARFTCDGILAAHVGDLHVCPRRGHGVTPIVDGSLKVEGFNKYVACIGSSTGCGAIINTGSFSTRVPFNPDGDPDNGFILDDETKAILDQGVM